VLSRCLCESGTTPITVSSAHNIGATSHDNQPRRGICSSAGQHRKRVEQQLPTGWCSVGCALACCVLKRSLHTGNLCQQVMELCVISKRPSGHAATQSALHAPGRMSRSTECCGTCRVRTSTYRLTSLKSPTSVTQDNYHTYGLTTCFHLIEFATVLLQRV
jgi:hypothetical protein